MSLLITSLVLSLQISDASPMCAKAATKELPQYVGYAEIRAATGLDKRQIQRLMTTGKFPRPEPLYTRANRWRVEVINEWLSQRATDQASELTKAAQSDPSKLAPDELEEAAIELAAAYLSQASGRSVSRDEVVLARKATDAENAALEAGLEVFNASSLEAFVSRLQSLEKERQLVLVAWMFPAIAALLKPDMPKGDEAAALGRLALMRDDIWVRAMSGREGFLAVMRDQFGVVPEDETNGR